MSLLSRLANVFRADRLSRDIDEELASHLAEAAERGRDPLDVRRAFGSSLRYREQSRDLRLLGWLDSLRADTVFGWRHLRKRKITSGAAVLSLALAIGSCTAAFRLIDALLLRPLPVANPEQLYSVARQGMADGKLVSADMFAYPDFALMRDAVRGRATLIAISYTELDDLTYGSDAEIEKAHLQYVSGSMFECFGLRPSLGRLLTPNDDQKPGAHPYAVLSYDYWSRRFARDPHVIGRTFHLGERIFEIVGVGPERFTGTDTGTVVDLFVPTMMHPGVVRDDWTWMRSMARIPPGTPLEPIRAVLDTTSRSFERERARHFTDMPPNALAEFLAPKVILEPAASGVSDMQSNYRTALVAMAVLVALVLLIACANVANLMTAQSAARAREMALRVSIGAGRWRLVQLVLVESAWLAIFSAVLGAWFAWWSAPFVVNRISPPDNPVRLFLPADWRVLAFGFALTAAVALLFGLAPALRASAVKPVSALRGGVNPHARRRLMHTLIALQVTFCFLVLFAAGLFASTLQHLSNRPLGFSADRLLAVDAVTPHAVAPVFWSQVANHLGALPGVESVAVGGFPLLSGGSWNGFISVNGGPLTSVVAYFDAVSPGWLDTMRIPIDAGRDFRPNDTTPGTAIVNETFVRQFLPDSNPLGQSIAKGGSIPFRIVGVVRDTPYRSIHEPTVPIVFVPFVGLDSKGQPEPRREATFFVRTRTAEPMSMAATIRREVPRGRSEFRVSDIVSQAELVRAQTIRERMLATLALFFAGVALLLGSIGLYGVLDYAVLQRSREIGIRMAIGAPATTIVRGIISDAFLTVAAGAIAGIGLGMALARYIASLLYQARPTDIAMLALPLFVIFAAALLAALPAAVRAVSIDPAATLRAE
jgi:putative ABC transport system permease protein